MEEKEIAEHLKQIRKASEGAIYLMSEETAEELGFVIEKEDRTC